MAHESRKGGGHVCPWWFAYTFDNPLRRLVHDPRSLLSPYVEEGMTVVDTGCGMGHFTLGLAELVGRTGRVVAVDLQRKMLDITMKRAARSGIAGRIDPRQCGPEELGLREDFDFALAFWMVHEVPDPGSFFGEVRDHLRPGGCLLYTEPSFHVGKGAFRDLVTAAREKGLVRCAVPEVRFSRAVLLRRD